MGQMAEGKAVTIASRQLGDECAKESRPDLLTLKAGIDVHPAKQQVASLISSPYEADRALT
jgi:hypothetical protein